MNDKLSKTQTCGYNNLKRTRYFHGQLLTERDFRDEQIYHNEKRKLLNKTLHGWGVVCGLKVKATNPASQFVIVEPGLALDCHGNEIMVCEEQKIDLAAALSSLDGARSSGDLCAEYLPAAPRLASELYIVIKYRESPSDPVPVYAPSASCEEKTCDYSRTDAGFCIVAMDHHPHPQETSASDRSSEPFEPCKEPYPCPPNACCPDPHYIVLARISCGPRFDALASKRIYSSDKSTSIRFLTSRRITNSVCVDNDASSERNRIGIEASFFFESDDNEISDATIEWGAINPDHLPAGVTPVDLSTDPVKGHRDFKREFALKVDGTTEKGEVEIQLPVNYLEFEIGGNKKRWEESDLPSLKSLIVIGKPGLQRESVVYEALIRNLECRKYAASFPWIAWLMNRYKERNFDDPPWAGELTPICTAQQSAVEAQGLTHVEVARLIVRAQEQLREEMLARIDEIEKNAVLDHEKIEKDYKQKLAAITKTTKSSIEKTKQEAATAREEMDESFKTAVGALNKKIKDLEKEISRTPRTG